MVKQVKIPGYTRTRAGVDDSTFFLRERGLSSGTQNHAIAEGRGLLEVEILLYCTPLVPLPLWVSKDTTSRLVTLLQDEL